MNAIVIGASGLTGSYLLQLLLQHPSYTNVTALVRSPIQHQHPKLKQLVVDFNQLDKYAAAIMGDVVFCALGTTKRKTPDVNEYRKIDYQYPLDVARIALANGATQYHLVSALGANEHSSIFYSRLKGEVERDLEKHSFKTICIYRPSLLVGQRNEQRFGEKVMTYVMKAIDPLLIGGLKKYRSIHIEQVAKAMLHQSLAAPSGVFTFDSDIIKQLADQ